MRTACHVQQHLSSGGSSAENHSHRRAEGTTMDIARPAFRALGSAAQIKLGKVARSKRRPQLCSGREQRDVRGLEGERVLAAMIKDGAHFIATGVYTKHILETLQKRRHRWIRKFIGCS